MSGKKLLKVDTYFKTVEDGLTDKEIVAVFNKTFKKPSRRRNIYKEYLVVEKAKKSFFAKQAMFERNTKEKNIIIKKLKKFIEEGEIYHKEWHKKNTQ